MANICILCSEVLGEEDDLSLVKRPGLKTLKKVSEERKDGIFDSINCEFLFHRNCRVHYSARRYDGSFSHYPWNKHKRKASDDENSNSSGESAGKKTRRSDSFDFESRCFICTQPIPYIGQAKPKNDFVKITTEDVRHSVSQFLIQCANKGYPQYQEAADRLLDARLDTETPKYENKCFLACKRYLAGKLTGKPAHRPRDEEISAGIDKIINFIQESEDVVFKLSELHAICGRFM